MMLMLLLLLVVLVLFGAGFALHLLWWVAISLCWSCGCSAGGCVGKRAIWYGQAAGGARKGPGQVGLPRWMLTGPPVAFRADLGDTAVDIRAPQAQAERPALATR